MILFVFRLSTFSTPSTVNQGGGKPFLVFVCVYFFFKYLIHFKVNLNFTFFLKLNFDFFNFSDLSKLHLIKSLKSLQWLSKICEGFQER